MIEPRAASTIVRSTFYARELRMDRWSSPAKLVINVDPARFIENIGAGGASVERVVRVCSMSISDTVLLLVDEAIFSTSVRPRWPRSRQVECRREPGPITAPRTRRTTGSEAPDT